MATHQQLCRQFSLDEIKAATNNFDNELIIGRGGFGFVYAGVINKIVAIKRLSSESNQGETEFMREIEMLSRVQHHNLVCLEGYCNESPEKILVYEYMPNGTLVDHLYKTRGSATNTGDNQPHHLTWEERLNISIGAAQGLDFLHSGVVPGIIHRDIKDSNILLDSNLTAKISDFGLAKLVKMTNDPMINSASTTLVKGSFGYLDPEYFYTQRLSTKTDIYAFGVVLLVLLSGRPAVDNKAVEEDKCGIVEWAMKSIAEKRLDLIIDPDLDVKSWSKSLHQFVKIVHKCLCRQSEQRPTMKEVVAGLQLALKKQPTTSGSSSRELGKRTILTQTGEAKLRIMMEKQNEMTRDQNVLNDIITRLWEMKLGIESKPEDWEKEVQLSEAEIRLLCIKARHIFLSEPSLLEVQAPIDICGTVNGDYQHLLEMFVSLGLPPTWAYLFLGNYDSLETIWLLLAYKILCPDKVFLLRGNHEGANKEGNYRFYAKCRNKFSDNLWETFTDCFNCLPVAALVGGKIFCVHGGLSPELKHIKQINELPRPTEIPNKGLLHDLLTSLPSTNKGWGNGDGGDLCTFGEDKVAEFLQTNGLDLICRCSQLVEYGQRDPVFFADRGVVTIPQFNSLSSIVSIDKKLEFSLMTLTFRKRLVRWQLTMN